MDVKKKKDGSMIWLITYYFYSMAELNVKSLQN